VRGGRLTLGERAHVLARATVAQLRALRADRRGALGWTGPREPAALAREITPPETRLTRVALDACQRACEPWLVAHCERSYAWGALLALRDGRRFDREAFYVAALLHDLALSAAYPTPPGACFALVGADAARELLQAAGAPREYTELVADAIAMHLNVRPDELHGPEVRLLQAGTACDVVGLGLRALPPAAREVVLARHARQGMKVALVAVMRAQARQSPDTRIGFMCRALGFLRLVRRAPFDE
jgi:hypothetical protein